MAKKNALVAGSAGFLGSHFADALIAKNFFVYGVDNLCTGNIKNLQHLNKRNFKFVKHDIIKPLPPIITSIKFELVANFACPASPPHYKKLALETLLVSSLGVMNLLEIARKNKCRFLHTSTSEIYGDPLEHPQKENYWGNVNSYGVRSMYDEGKRFAEALIWVYKNKFKVNTGIARIFNTYGPRMDPGDGRVVTQFITQALKNKPLTIEGDGSQTRTFCFVEDQIDGLAKLAFSKLEGPINIGGDKEITIKELALLINKITDNNSGIKYVKRTKDDPNKRKPSIRKAKKELNWKPTTSLKIGLYKTIEYLKSTI